MSAAYQVVAIAYAGKKLFLLELQSNEMLAHWHLVFYLYASTTLRYVAHQSNAVLQVKISQLK